MTVAANTTFERAVIDGEGPYEFPFRIFDEAELAVSVSTGELDPAVLTLGADYSVTGVDVLTGGSITLTPDAATAYDGATLDIRSNVQVTQPTSIRNLGEFLPGIHEDAFDRLNRQIQDMDRKLNSKFGYPDDTDLIATMTNRAAWSNRFLYVDDDGEIQPAVAASTPVTQSVVSSLLASDPEQSTEDLVEVLGTQRTTLEIAAIKTPIDYTKIARPIMDISRYVSDNTGAIDVTAEMLDAVASEKNIIIPAGAYRISTPIPVRAGMTITGGGGPLSTINAYGCNAFAVNGDFACIEKVAIFSLTSGGSADPKAYDGIKVTGVNGAQRNVIVIRDVFAQGWLNCVNHEYTWDSVMDGLITANSKRGYRSFGESVGNKIANSRLTCDGSEPCIITVVNGGDHTEGLKVSNSDLLAGAYGGQFVNVIGISIHNTFIDLIANKGLEFSACESVDIDLPWIEAASSCIDFLDQGSPANVGATVRVARARTTGVSGHCIRVGSNNNGVQLNLGKVELSNAGSSNYPIALLADALLVSAHIVNATSQKAVIVSDSNAAVGMLTGDITINRTVQASFPGTLTGVSGTVTGTINYVVNGETVMLEFPIIEGTSTTTAATITGMPAALWPRTDQEIIISTKDNGTVAIAKAIVSSSTGTITLHSNLTSATFTGSGTKGIGKQTKSYKRT